ncbi:MAG: tRNA (adenosine(37)-N6)-threonylcarbamoyltransferase complex dimerization subunit type 1 TsaB [Bacteroidales bacterium]|nr:tRNA (adenosine(37)-N6)-threonylcarbamoyltransferase complex dimerization subunit type 1 TsaB [Bacteroidales bacterium]
MEPLFINIDTSTDICSVSLSRGTEVIGHRENQSRDHASTLGPYIQQLLDENNLKVKDLSGVAVSKGPGSYTGLRIGTSTAKGMAYQAGIKLLAIDTLQAMALKATKQLTNPNTIICATIDAGRNEVYSELFDMSNNTVRQCIAEIISSDSYTDTLAKTPMAFVGNGAEKISKIINNPNAIFIPEIKPSAVYMAALTAKAFNGNDFADVAYFEPFYLKDYVATVSKKNVLKQTS